MEKVLKERASAYANKKFNKIINESKDHPPFNASKVAEFGGKAFKKYGKVIVNSFKNANTSHPTSEAATMNDQDSSPNIYQPSTPTATEGTKPYTPNYPSNAPTCPNVHANAWGGTPVPPPSSAFCTPQGVPNAPPSCTIFPAGLLDQVATRPVSAVVKFGEAAIREACKGLSRVLNLQDSEDVYRFQHQLMTADATVVEYNYENINDDIPCFALSYVHRQDPIGRFKFSDAQWAGLLRLCATMAKQGILRVRFWVDQCLWIRDTSSGAWAHTGILPYIMWPVISLGVRTYGKDRSREGYERMWPFVEEVAGLWSMGVIFVYDMRGRSMAAGAREKISFSLRNTLPPEDSMMIVLYNVYHGAADLLKTGWSEDVDELKEMARWNVNCKSENVFVGSDWKKRVMAVGSLSSFDVVGGLAMPVETKYSDDINVYLEGSRAVQLPNWSGGVLEFMSGNPSAMEITERDTRRLHRYLTKVNVVTDRGEFQLLMGKSHRKTMWLLVAMKGRSANFSRGKVAWTKVVVGEGSCRLEAAVKAGNVMVVQTVLSEQLESSVQVQQVNEITSSYNAIEWL